MPITLDKVHHVIQYLDSLVPSSLPTLARLMVEHNALLALLTWETSKTGKSCGGDLVRTLHSDGQSLKLPLPSPFAKRQPADQAQWDKNSQRAQVRAFCPDSW